MDNQDIPQSTDGEQEEPVLNRAARRGHASKNQGVQKVPGRPHQNMFVGRRVFRRTGG